jgi:tripartite-type tricarboxylate transporter receptor subunit TctC
MTLRQAKAFLTAAAAVWLTNLMPASANGQKYPARPVQLVSPYGVGGNADLAARAFASVASKYLGQQIVVVNRVGAGGIVGSQYVVDAPQDGHTLLLARVGSQAIAPALDPATTYKWDSFTFIGMLELDPYVCVVDQKSPYKTFNQLLSAIKSRPGKLSYASTGNFDASVVFPVQAMLNLNLPADAALKVPYRGAGDTVGALRGGHVDFACNGIGAYMGQMRGGELRALVVSTPDRVPDAPDVPTATEVGMPNLQVVTGWSALYGPPSLPKGVVQTWIRVIERVKNDPEWINQVRKRGVLPSIMSPDETRKFVQAQYEAYRALKPYFETK